MGPGVVGTDTTLGTTSVEMAAVLAAVERLGGVPVPIVRASSADARERHRGISHHTRSALALVAIGLDVPVPPELAEQAGDLGHHRALVIEPTDVVAALDAARLTVTTMGRGPADDPGFFRAAGAAATRGVDLLARPDTVAPA
jgi:hypothetical protein